MAGDSNTMDLEQKRREEARWRILRVLDAGRPVGVSESLVYRVLADLKLALSPNGVRRELTYLRDLALAELETEDGETWHARLTAEGVNVVEYVSAAPPGIARPKKYW